MHSKYLCFKITMLKLYTKQVWSVHRKTLQCHSNILIQIKHKHTNIARTRLKKVIVCGGGGGGSEGAVRSPLICRTGDTHIRSRFLFFYVCDEYIDPFDYILRFSIKNYLITLVVLAVLKILYTTVIFKLYNNEIQYMYFR